MHNMLTRRAFVAALSKIGLTVSAGMGLASASCSNAAPTAKPAATSAPAQAPTSAPTVAAAPTSPTAAAASPTTTAVKPIVAAATATTAPAPAVTSAPAVVAGKADLAVAKGSSPAAITKAAIDALGGITRFVKKGDKVLIKPNICCSSKPEYAATTNPEVVGTLVKLCKEAGAASIKIVDGPFTGISTAYDMSGIKAEVEKNGGTMEMVSRVKFKSTEIPKGKDIKKWDFYEDALTADVIINVPIAKNHNLAVLTLGMKNMMGVVDDRNSIHININQRLADLATRVRPTLTVVDAVRILTRNGPTGGSLDFVKKLDTVIATTDIVAADAYGATLFGMKQNALGYVRNAAEMGLGTMDLSKLAIANLTV